MCPHCVLALLGGVAASVPALSYLHHKIRGCRKSDTGDSRATTEQHEDEESERSSHEE